MIALKFSDVFEAIDCYGRENLIPIDNIKQILFYVRHGCQPKFVYESEVKPGRLTAWFLKTETRWVYRKWLLEQDSKSKEEKSGAKET